MLIVVAMGAAVVFTAAPAGAQLDPSHCTSAQGGTGLGDNGQAGGGAGGGGGGSWGGAASAPSTTSTTMKLDGEEGDCSSLLDTISPGPNPGTYPTSHYDIGYDEGGNCICTSRRITGWATASLFTITRYVVRIGLGLINWALEFSVARLLMPTAQRISSAYQNQIIARTGLPAFFLVICAAWAGVLMMTGRLGRGITEIGTSLLIVGAASAFWANPGPALTRGLEFSAGVSGDIAAVGTGADTEAPTSKRAVGASMALAIHKGFIENTHMILNWSRIIPVGDRCRAVYDQAVATGPWGTSSQPRKAMKAAGCTTEDAFNRNPSQDRLGAAFLVMLASIALIGMLLLVTYHVIRAQLEVLLALVLWPFALATASLPGWGRAAFWHWVGSTAKAFVKVMAMTMVLALTLTAVAAVLTATATEKLVPQMGMVVIVVAVGMFKAKGVIAGAERSVGKWTAAMSGGRTSGIKGGWLSPASAGFGAGALANKAQHAIQAHGNNSRSRRLLDITEQGNAVNAAGWGNQTLNYYDLDAHFADGAQGRPTPPPPTPQRSGRETPGLGAGRVITVDPEAVREHDPILR